MIAIGKCTYESTATLSPDTVLGGMVSIIYAVRIEPLKALRLG